MANNFKGKILVLNNHNIPELDKKESNENKIAINYLYAIYTHTKTIIHGVY